MRRSGLPSPGTEGMGVLFGVGAQVGDFAVGDRVTTTQAERTYADAFLVDAAKAKEGDVAVVTAAAGGVGGLLVQLLRKQGATVIALVGSEEKADAARSLGADVALVGYGDFAERVREATGGRLADVVYDSVGRDTFGESLRALRSRGMLVLYGASSGPVPDFDLQRLNHHGSLYVTRPTIDDYLQDQHERSWRSREIFDAVIDGSLKVRIAGTFPLAESGRAQAALQSRAVTGKLLLVP